MAVCCSRVLRCLCLRGDPEPTEKVRLKQPLLILPKNRCHRTHQLSASRYYTRIAGIFYQGKIFTNYFASCFQQNLFSILIITCTYMCSGCSNLHYLGKTNSYIWHAYIHANLPLQKYPHCAKKGQSEHKQR